MRLVIVGHGPSLLQETRGAEIDDYDFIVRLKRSRPLLERLPDHYGTRTHAVLGSRTLGQAMFDHWPDTRIWLFNDTRTEMDSTPPPPFCTYDPGLCGKWRARYRILRGLYEPAETQQRCGELSDTRGHKHPSAGFHAVMYAMDVLHPDRIKLLGFDSMLSGRHDWSVTRGPNYDSYPDHNWPAEQTLLNELAKEFEYTVERIGEGEAIIDAI